ncbi:MAG: ABC transporter permease subunit [Haloferacaceae archaeon]
MSRVLEITRYEGRQKLRASILLTVGFVGLAALYIWLFPSIEQSGVDFAQYLETLPEGFQSAFAVESISTIEGFLAIELYQFLWLLLFGIYMAYTAGGLVAEDVEDDRIELLLATPVSRTRIVFEKFASLGVPILVANALIPFAVVAGVAAIGESISTVDLLAVHLLSIPYLLACGSVGLLLSVWADRASVAQRGGIVAVFMLFLVETVSSTADYDWLGAISPTRYYDPAEILVDGTYDLAGSLILLTGTVALVLLSAAYFQRRDVP